MSRAKKWAPTRHGGWTTIRLAPHPFVSVYCRGEESSPHDKWRIAAFEQTEHNGGRFWAESISGYADHDSDRYFRTLPSITQYLDGDRWIAQQDVLSLLEDSQLRSRWMIRCRICRFGAAFASPRS